MGGRGEGFGKKERYVREEIWNEYINIENSFSYSLSFYIVTKQQLLSKLALIILEILVKDAQAFILFSEGNKAHFFACVM